MSTTSVLPVDSNPAALATPIRGACPHDCPDTCSLLTTVENGIAIKVQGNPDHPQTGGVLCNKVSGQSCGQAPRIVVVSAAAGERVDELCIA